MDRTELWLGEQDDPASEIKQIHETWVKALVSELLSTGVVKDEVMCKIGPLCALKVGFSLTLSLQPINKIFTLKQ